MAGRIIIGGRLNLTVSFISSLSSLGYISLPAPPLPPPLPSLPFVASALYLSFSAHLPASESPATLPLSFSPSEFCAKLPAIIIIALLPIISTTPLRNCTSMLLIHFLFGQRGRSRWTRSRKFRCVISAPLSRARPSLATRGAGLLYILQQHREKREARGRAEKRKRASDLSRPATAAIRDATRARSQLLLLCERSGTSLARSFPSFCKASRQTIDGSREFIATAIVRTRSRMLLRISIDSQIPKIDNKITTVQFE